MQEIHTDFLHAIYHAREAGECGPDYLSYEAAAPVRQLHGTLENYQPTPLGGLYALARVVCREARPLSPEKVEP